MTVAPPVPMLNEVVRKYGTPTYAYDRGLLKQQVSKLRSRLPSHIDVFYSLKANASLGLCSLLAEQGLGADVASPGELVTALAAGFPASRVCVTGPHKSPETVERLEATPETLVSLDSVHELESLARTLPNPLLLRLRPDFASSAVVAAGRECRFGATLEEMIRRRDSVREANLVGFHVFAGSQVLDADAVIAHLRGAMDLALRAADSLGISPEVVNLGGGFGIPYTPDQRELDLGAVAEELDALQARAPATRLMLELGRYLVGPSGWYLTRVLGQQTHQGRPAVVVDGGTHQRADLCGLGLRCGGASPVALIQSSQQPRATDILGSLSLPDDVLAEGCALPPLAPGDIVAFPNAGAYGLWASPALFHGHPLPAEVVFDGETLVTIRERGATEDLLKGQARP